MTALHIISTPVTAASGHNRSTTAACDTTDKVVTRVFVIVRMTENDTSDAPAAAD